MKVLFFCNVVPAKTGAFENLLTELGRVFKDSGDQLILGLAGEPIEKVAAAWRSVGLTWELLPGWTDAGGSEHPWAFCRPALRLLRRHHPDVAAVHFGNELPSLITGLLAPIAGAPRVKWVWQQDQRIADPTPLTAPLSRIRLLALAFDRLVAVYEGGKRSLTLRGVPEEQISVIPNGVADHPRRREQGWLKQELGLPNEAVIAVSIGSLIPRKRIDFMLRALAGAKGAEQPPPLGSYGVPRRAERQGEGGGEGTNIQHRTSNIEHRTKDCSAPICLLIVGTGAEEEKLRSLSRELGLSDCVRFLGQRNDVRDILLEADLLVHSATAEASSYAILESMAAGIPAVVTRAGAAEEQIADGESGFVPGDDQADEFVEKWARLIRDAPLRQRMGEAARKRWQERYRVEDSARRYHELYRALAAFGTARE